MSDTVTILLFAILTTLAAIFGLKRGEKKKKQAAAPKNKAADAARETAKKDFDEKVSAIKDDLSGDSPADDLAARGNTRRRR